MLKRHITALLPQCCRIISRAEELLKQFPAFTADITGKPRTRIQVILDFFEVTAFLLSRRHSIPFGSRKYAIEHSSFSLANKRRCTFVNQFIAYGSSETFRQLQQTFAATSGREFS